MLIEPNSQEIFFVLAENRRLTVHTVTDLLARGRYTFVKRDGKGQNGLKWLEVPGNNSNV